MRAFSAAASSFNLKLAVGVIRCNQEYGIPTSLSQPPTANAIVTLLPCTINSQYTNRRLRPDLVMAHQRHSEHLHLLGCLRHARRAQSDATDSTTLTTSNTSLHMCTGPHFVHSLPLLHGALLSLLLVFACHVSLYGLRGGVRHQLVSSSQLSVQVVQQDATFLSLLLGITMCFIMDLTAQNAAQYRYIGRFLDAAIWCRTCGYVILLWMRFWSMSGRRNRYFVVILSESDALAAIVGSKSNSSRHIPARLSNAFLLFGHRFVFYCLILFRFVQSDRVCVVESVGRCVRIRLINWSVKVALGLCKLGDSYVDDSS